MMAVHNTVVDIAEKVSAFTEHCSPEVAARLNDYEITVVKLDGVFVWHTHDSTDELFFVVSGELVDTGDAGGPPTAAYDDSLA